MRPSGASDEVHDVELIAHREVPEIVRAVCPGCEGALSTFEYQRGGSEYGAVVQNALAGRNLYVLMNCGGCGRGGLATIHDTVGRQLAGILVEFYPAAIDRATLPATAPPDLS
jgi:hypothetical protein